MQPLILTLTIDPIHQEYFNQLRKQYFPPERNFLDAHLSLFHQLPPNESKINDVITNICQQQSAMELKVTEVKNIGSGVAYKVESKELMLLHQMLQKEWQQWLIPQDQHKLWPHITIQNKVEPAAAAALRNGLAQEFNPFTIHGIGLSLWEYQNGPWELIKNFSFSG